MQNPVETRSPVDNEVGLQSPREGSTQDPAAGVQRSSAGSHSIPQPKAPPIEVGGPSGPEPTRYGDWERNGRCIDF
jgi:hypothetical protein